MDKIIYINKVEMIDAGLLSSSTFSNQGAMISNDLPFIELCTVGLSNFEIADKVENKVRIFHHSLNTKLAERLNVSNRKLCFRLTAVDGTQYMIGTDTRPYPLVQQEELHPSELSQNCVVKLDINWKSVCFYKVL